ncbi:sensor histidine kinase [Rhizobium sp. C1]|uniref:sensor histidine kinase n=1 Tax=Rhizobium sp. C1 TaxID=1349799 RepID=UPI001E2F8A3C|nr:HAMP domain-containing sensor histidine kinase [Rhizobium sp. C1]MCD2179315.1 HAMP domain-containing histidine kinase [Rhizobium sp. C1]
MHPAKFWRSTPFRLAVAYALLFVTSSLLVYFLTYELLRRELYATLDASVAETYSVIQSTYSSGRIDDLQKVMEAFSKLEKGYLSVFYLEAPDGKRLAGNVTIFKNVNGVQTATGAELGLTTGGRFRIFTGAIDGNRLLVGQSLGATDELAHIIFSSFAWMTVATSLLAIAVGIFLARRAQDRIAAIAQTMNEISDGQFSKRVQLAGRGDDIDLISGQINAALDRLSDLMAGMKQVSADIAHDLKTPLNRLKLILEEAAIRQESGQAVGDQLQEALVESDRINGTFQALLRISQIEAGTRKSRFTQLDMKQIFENVAEIFSGVAEDNGQTIHLIATPVGAFPIEGDKELLTQMTVNLVENAINHCPEGTRITLSLERQGRAFAAIVADNGYGIEEGEREKVFRRLYRLDKSRNSPGHGLGLSMVKAIADLHRLTIKIEDNRPGARFVLTWADQTAT